MNTRRNLLIILAGLVLFVAFYAIYFPQSQMPINIKSETIWTQPNNNHIVDEVLVIAAPFVATNHAVLRIEGSQATKTEYPAQETLPEMLSWGDPSILNLFTNGQKLALQVSSGFYVQDWDSKGSPSAKWQFEENINGFEPSKTNPNWVFKNGELLVKDNEGKTVFEVTNPKESWIESVVDGNVSLIFGGRKYQASDLNSKTNLVFPKTTQKGQRGVFIEPYEFVPTKDGRISKVLNGSVVAELDRSNTSLQMVPSKLTTDGENIYGLLSPVVKNAVPAYWVQAYDKNLKWKGDLVPARSELRPVSIAFHEKMLLALWEDCFLIGYSTDGFEMFREQVTTDFPLDMLSDGELIYLLTSNQLLRLTMTIKNSSLPIWPRISYLGQIDKDEDFEITVVTMELPAVTIKGRGIKLNSIAQDDNNVKIKLTASPFALEAYFKHQAEIIIEAENKREIVPVIFYPTGTTHHLKIVADQAINVINGKRYAYEQKNGALQIIGLNVLGKTKTYWNRITSEAIVLNPAPGEKLANPGK